MPNFSTDSDISVDEFLDMCDEKELNEVVDWIKENTDLYPGEGIIPETPFDYALINLIGCKHRLTKEEEEIIMNISNQF